MPSIVLDSFSRASIRFEKLATQEADRLAQLQTTAQIDIKEARSVPFKAGADRLAREISDIEFELSKADKLLGGIETSLSAIDSMRAMVDRIKGLEDAAAAETSTALATSYTEQIAELKEQMKTLGETASFRGNNFFSGWDQESFSIGGQNFAVQGVDINDVVSGFAYRGGNVLGIENGEFDSSAYSNLVAAYGPNTIDNTYTDFTGNNADGIMANGATIAQIGPNGSYGVDFAAPNTTRATGSHVQIPSITLPTSYSIGQWVKMDATGSYNRVFDISNDYGGVAQESIILTRFSTQDRMGIWYNGDNGSGWDFSEITAPGTIVNGDWAYWMVTVEDLGTGDLDFTIYKDGAQVANTTRTLPSLGGMTLNDVYLGAGDNNFDATLDGAVADFVVFDGAFDAAGAADWYNSVGLTGLENSFFTMKSDTLGDALDKIEAHLTGVQVSVEATRNQLAVKSELYAEEATSLLSIDSEEVAIQSSLAGMRQTLAVTSLGITSSTQANILNLFG